MWGQQTLCTVTSKDVLLQSVPNNMEKAVPSACPAWWRRAEMVSRSNSQWKALREPWRVILAVSLLNRNVKLVNIWFIPSSRFRYFRYTRMKRKMFHHWRAEVNLIFCDCSSTTSHTPNKTNPNLNELLWKPRDANIKNRPPNIYPDWKKKYDHIWVFKQFKRVIVYL